jgi:short-subunit dehydrogenase
MKLSPGQTALVTGASGGLGTYLTYALAKRGLKLALVAYPGMELEKLRAEVEHNGVTAVYLAADLREAEQRHAVVDFVHRELGDLDLLVNNAGVEYTSNYDALSEKSIRDVLSVNLEAPMLLTRLFLPEMLRRKQGHIVNMSSLAGKSGPAFQEPYAASKAGLIAFTASLRATYRGTGVSASAIVPGFVEAGIYAALKKRTGCAAPLLLGASPPEAVVRAFLRAIEKDLPEIIVNPLPVRPLLALTALCPRLGEWLAGKTGANDFFRRAVENQTPKLS